MDNEKRRKINENTEMEIETRRKVTAVVIGCGQRGTGYSNYSRQFPDLLQIVGVADPKKNRRYFFNFSYLFHSSCFIFQDNVWTINLSSGFLTLVVGPWVLLPQTGFNYLPNFTVIMQLN